MFFLVPDNWSLDWSSKGLNLGVCEVGFQGKANPQSQIHSSGDGGML